MMGYSLHAGIDRRVTVGIPALLAVILSLQRLAVPGTPVALILPVAIMAGLVGCALGAVEVDQGRATLWLLAAISSGIVVILGQALAVHKFSSISSWGLLLTTWLPSVLRLRDRSEETFEIVVARSVKVIMFLAGACIIMWVSQQLGLAYRDYVAEAIPASMLIDGYVITYPTEYGSTIVRSNAWIGLEPSIVSFALGLGFLLALRNKSRGITLAIILGAMLTTFSGSGFIVLIVGIFLMVARKEIRFELRTLIFMGVLGLAAALSTIGEDLLARTDELTNTNSSASLRAVQPYVELLPIWLRDPSWIVSGVGPGSSQQIIENARWTGLLVTTPIKLFFDYGLLVGAILAILLGAAYLGSRSPSIAGSLFVSLWALQPGTTTAAIVFPLFLFCTLWSPAFVESCGGGPTVTSARRVAA